MLPHFNRRSLLKTIAAIAAIDLMPLGVRSAPILKQPLSLPIGGVNLAGADFGKIPGKHGEDYLYPKHKNVDYYRNLGFGIIRLPFKWERLQPELNEAFAPREADLLREIVGYATGSGMQMILDPHNYAKRRTAADQWNTEHSIGSALVPAPAFFDFWARLAEVFKHDERVVFGLMNEPVGLKASAWRDIVNGTIAAIRRTGAQNLILVPGVDYTGAHSWFKAGNTAMANVIDPVGHYAFDVHQYFDNNSSGTHAESVSGTIGSERIEAFQEWARAHGFKAFLGEFNGGRNQTSYNALNDICQEVSANPDVWLGWAAWAGGPRWPEKDMYNLEPWSDGRIREQTRILAHYAKPPSDTYWIAPGAAVDLDFARNRVFGAPSFDAVLSHAQAAAPNAARSDGIARGDGHLTAKGLRLDARGENRSVSEPDHAATSAVFLAKGTLLSILQQPAFTLVIETRDLPTDQIICDLLTGSGEMLLRRTADGAVESGLGMALRTSAQTLSNWRAKRRVAVSIKRPKKRAALGATGVKAVAADGSSRAIEKVLIGGVGSSATRKGYITRITAYSDFIPADALDALLA
jgi:endoglucanase